MELFGYTYATPWAFYFLGLIPLLILWYILYSSKKNPSLLTSSSKAFEGIKRGFVSYLRHFPFLLRLVALCFLIIALARPQKKLDDDTIIEQSIEGIDIVISLDISQSMLAMDFSPNRLEASKQVAKDFIKKRPTDRIGLVVYEGESYTACALTTDHESLLKRFKNVKSGKIQGGTAIGMGLATGINRLRESEAKSKVIILLTDGENNTGKVHPLTAADYAKEFGIRVYTIGVGTKGKAKMPVGTNPFTKQTVYDYIEGKIDEQMLTQIAEQTGGKYYRAKNKKQLASIYDEIDKLEKAKINTIMYKKDLPEAFHWFVIMGLLFLVGEFLVRNVLIRKAI
jgi:Ca-activated chloride channel family protein